MCEDQKPILLSEILEKGNSYYTIGLLYILLLVILFLIIVFYKKKSYFQYVKTTLVPMTITSGIFLYYIAYSVEHKWLESSLLSLFSTARLFILGNDLIEIHEYVKNYPGYFFWFSIIGVSAAVISASIMLNLFGKRLIEWLKLYFKSYNKYYIFFGINEASISLAQNIKNKDKQIVFIQYIHNEKNENLVYQVEELGAVIISNNSVFDFLEIKNEEAILHTAHTKNQTNKESDIFKNSLLKKKIQNSQSHLFFLTEDEDWNLRTSRLVINQLNHKLIKKDARVWIHILTISDRLEDLYIKWPHELSEKIEIHLHNYATILAHQFIEGYKPIDLIDDKEINTEKAIVNADFTTMLLGFNPISSAILRKQIEHGQFIGSKFKAIVLDKDIDSKQGSFEVRYSGLVDNYDILFAKSIHGSLDFYNEIKQSLDTLNCIIISLGDDELNMQTALDIQDLIKRTSIKKNFKIMVQINDNLYLKNDFYAGFRNIFIFGRNNEIFTEEIIIRSEIEEIAKKAHELYNKSSNKYTPWEKLDTIKHLSNISVAEHIYTKLKLAGLNVEKVKGIGKDVEFLDLLGGEKMENLAKGEHLHWNALYFANGWRKWDLKDIPQDATQNKDDHNKLHACLVDWNELPHVGKRFPKKKEGSLSFEDEDYIKYDKDTVASIFKYIKDELYIESPNSYKQK